MPVFNQSRSRIIRLIFLLTFIIILAQLINLQLVSSKYKRLADENAILVKRVYPSRGLVFDHKRKAIVNNTMAYDLMVTPAQVKNIDTSFFCQLMEIDTAEFNKRIISAIIKNRSYRPSIFEASLTPQKYARMQENLWRFESGFYLQERPIRTYPFNTAANIVGYISEVDSNYIKKHSEQGYQSGDYAGMTGLEASYEKALMGEVGIQYLIKDKLNRINGPYENGTLDQEAVAGSNLYTSLDVELQLEGELLMNNKVGSIVAIDPKTGGILAMVSSPTFNPNYLTGADRRKHFSQLYQDPKLPLLNRAVNATYSPGSTFKTLQALVGLHEGVIDTKFRVSCSGAYYGCGNGRPKCLDYGTFDLRSAITKSDNTYFATVMQKVINNPVFPSIDSSLSNWNSYMYAFGLGHKLGVDVPTERSGFIPTPKYFDKVYGKGRWNYCNFVSCSIGQGEVNVTPIQVANEMAYIANKGWYYIPHVVDSIEGGDKFELTKKYKEKIIPTEIPDSIFEAVHDGMQGVMESGTGAGARVPGVTVCGKTGTVENYYRGVKQPNHSFFAAFAPRENPRIAIMCVVENSGRFGGTYAAPIVSLMIEKYLNDTIAANRKGLEEKMANMNLIPPLMMQKIRLRDSLLQVKRDSIERVKKELKDTLQTEEDPEEEIITPKTNNQPVKDTPVKKSVTKSDMMLPVEEKKNPSTKNQIRP